MFEHTMRQEYRVTTNALQCLYECPPSERNSNIFIMQDTKGGGEEKDRVGVRDREWAVGFE